MGVLAEVRLRHKATRFSAQTGWRCSKGLNQVTFNRCCTHGLGSMIRAKPRTR